MRAPAFKRALVVGLSVFGLGLTACESTSRTGSAAASGGPEPQAFTGSVDQSSDSISERPARSAPRQQFLGGKRLHQR